ncbi:phylloplanin-like [Bidens hawaiensis]|uniref:phylloplanin-like n=1 Tax=Bidens hawaiensis TaxID=980011 RepID=UPI00404A681A
MAKISIILITILVVVFAEAQAEAQGLPPLLTAVFNVSGIVSCSINATTTAPPFPNALVQLSCGRNTIASAVTNAIGGFNIFVTPSQVNLGALLSSSCRVIVATPLATCNETLPLTGTLQGPLQLVGSTVLGVLNITSLIPSVLQLVRI